MLKLVIVHLNEYYTLHFIIFLFQCKILNIHIWKSKIFQKCCRWVSELPLTRIIENEKSIFRKLPHHNSGIKSGNGNNKHKLEVINMCP
jgi:hypothetical protein